LVDVGASISPIQDETGVITGFSYIARDVSQRLQRDAALRESQRALQTLISNLPGMSYRWRNDAGRTAEFVSEGCLELTGYSADEILNNQKSFARLIHPDDAGDVAEEIQAAILARRAFQLQYRIVLASGTEKWVWEQGRGVFDDAGTLLALEGLVHDISERRRAEAALEHQALHDALTDLPNRVFLRRRVEEATELARRDGQSTALLVLDLDRFKEVNDTLGHDHGDLLLREVAVRLQHALAAHASVARLGGDDTAEVRLGQGGLGCRKRSDEPIRANTEGICRVDVPWSRAGSIHSRSGTRDRLQRARSQERNQDQIHTVQPAVDAAPSTADHGVATAKDLPKDPVIK